MLERRLELTIHGLGTSGVIRLWCLASDSIVKKAPLFLVGQDNSEFFVRLHPPVFRFIVNGYAKEVLNKLPMEFAVEAQKLLAISLEGSVG